MTTTEPTKGPWGSDGLGVWSGLEFVALIGQRDGRGRANAALITAAPELLRALTRLQRAASQALPHVEDAAAARQLQRTAQQAVAALKLARVPDHGDEEPARRDPALPHGAPQHHG